MYDFLLHRDSETHKGDYGHALLIAGSYGKMGAAVLAAKACLRAGVGLLTVHVPRRGVDILQTALPEAMVSVDDHDFCFTSLPAHLERYDAIAVGPGLGTDELSQTALLLLLRWRESAMASGAASPLVIDADGINMLAKHPDVLHQALGAVVTPHDREYQRLFGDADAQAMSDLHQLVIVRKAHCTVVYGPQVAPVVNDTGNAGMATAGSGDVLTGIMLSVLAQQRAYSRRHAEVSDCTVQDLAALAVRMHGAAGDIAAACQTAYSIIASDLVETLTSPSLSTILR